MFNGGCIIVSRSMSLFFYEFSFIVKFFQIDDDFLSILVDGLNLDEECLDRFALPVSDELIASKSVKK